LLAAGELAGMMVAERAQPHEVQRAVHARGDLACVHVTHEEGKFDVATRRHVGEEGVALEDHADVPAVGRTVGEIAAVEQDGAFGGLLEARDHHERGRLARAARPQQRDELAARDGEVDAVHDAGATVVRLDEALQGQVAGARHSFANCAARHLRAAPRPSFSLMSWNFMPTAVFAA
jgi:hypothetical protein